MQKEENIVLLILGGVLTSVLLLLMYPPQTQNELHQPLESSTVRGENTITNFQSGHGFKQQSVAGIQIDDTTDFVIGKQSLKLITSGNGQTVFTRTNLSPSIDFTGKFLKVWIKISDTYNISELRIMITGDNFQTYKSYWIHGNGEINPKVKYLSKNQWNLVTISLTQTDNFGSPDISNINAIEIRVKDAGIRPVTVWFNGISLIKNHSKGIVTFTFDDAVDNQYTNARPILDKYNFSATAYIPTKWIGNKNKLTLEQLKVLHDVSGWDISAHTLYHTDLTEPSYEPQFEDMVASPKQYLLDNGFKGAEHFAYPYGHFDNDESMQLVKKYYKTARGTRGMTETLPVADQYKLRVMYVLNSTPPAQIFDRVQNAMDNGDWLILVFHSIVDSNTLDNEEYLKSKFEVVVDGIKEKGIDVMTISDVYNNEFH